GSPLQSGLLFICRINYHKQVFIKAHICPSALAQQVNGCQQTCHRHGDGVRQSQNNHAAIRQTDQRSQTGSQQEQERRLTVRCCNRRNVGTGIDRNSQQLKLLSADGTSIKCCLNFRDIYSCHKHVV